MTRKFKKLKARFLRGALISVIAVSTPIAMSSAALAADVERFAVHASTSNSVIDNAAWAGFLSKYVKPAQSGVNLVAYSEVSAEDKARLKAYIKSLESVNPTKLNADDAFSFWVNLYNAVTIDVVLDNYPVKSIKDIRSGLRAGPWKRDLVRVNGEALSLDNIEHDILRAFFNEPRVHYAVNCASIGCPNLATTPYEGITLDDQLNIAAKAYVNDPRGVTVTPNGDLVLSNIYKWFKKDFGTTDNQVISHIRIYADDELRGKLLDGARIRGYAYDWSLNDAK